METHATGEEPAGTRARAPEARFDALNSQSLRFLPDLVRDLGGDPTALFRKARISPQVVDRRDSTIAYRSFVQMLELAAADLKRPDFGMLLAQRQSGHKVMGPIGIVMKNSATVGQALGYCAKHIHAYCLATRVRFEPDRRQHILFVRLEVLLDGLPQRTQAVEHALLLAHRNIIEISGGRAAVRQVRFQHEPHSSPARYREHFGCDVRFGQPSDGIQVTEDDLLCPVQEADEQIYEMATSYIDSHFPQGAPPTHALVRELIRRHLADENCRNEFIAAELCMHARTLQRRLKDEGTTFEDLKDEVRRGMALHYLLNSGLPLAHVAEKLGYADTSVLTRSCNRWFGTSPHLLRQQDRTGSVAH
ncbi:AraC family transcriptional regulator [Nitrospirillum iridis]|uniref:AraC-like DNA-binding protein n=1 Tax=Nitrospirillum iridis TaxID=765888 RepID=A0A7X0EER1_9PROT|nr:AraC family transcriptional regulator [Nitrospirillum iridis]MBB6253290.1 AraC-like DNA-binding protein [Nitrospirillum iridis]